MVTTGLPALIFDCDGVLIDSEHLASRVESELTRELGLELTVEEAHAHFEAIPKIQKTLQVLLDVGLDYIQLGQSATTLSGGEAQRIKLATEFCKRSTGKTLYVLDEPSVGLHWDDLSKLIHLLNGLVDQGNTVLVIEHNLDVIAHADWIIDIGPGAGKYGGNVMFTGTVSGLLQNKTSVTAKYLRQHLRI